MSNSPRPNLTEDWTPAAGDEVASLSQYLKRVQRRRTVLRQGGLLAMMTLIGGVPLAGWLWRDATLWHEIECEKVLALLEDYLAERLEMEMVAKLERHFASCNQCRGHLQQLKLRSPLEPNEGNKSTLNS